MFLLLIHLNNFVQWSFDLWITHSFHCSARLENKSAAKNVDVPQCGECVWVCSVCSCAQVCLCMDVGVWTSACIGVRTWVQVCTWVCVFVCVCVHLSKKHIKEIMLKARKKIHFLAPQQKVQTNKDLLTTLRYISGACFKSRWQIVMKLHFTMFEFIIAQVPISLFR